MLKLLKKLFSNPMNYFRKLVLLVTGRATVIEIEKLTALQSALVSQSPYGSIENMRPPVFIIGPPRSGSTFLVAALNQHEHIYITNELRMMSFINDLFRIFLKSNRSDWNLSSEEKGNFLVHFRSQMAYVVKKFYAQKLKRIDDVWGDKHPHYTDPAMDPGAVDTILELFPKAKFIHLYRHPYAQINSYVQKGWKDFQYAVLAYRRIVTVGQALGKRVGEKQYIEISYEDLCDNGEAIMNQICEFLDIAPSEQLSRYMRSQELERIPYSIPVTPTIEIGKKKRYEFTPEQKEYMEKTFGELIRSLGYSLD